MSIHRRLPGLVATGSGAATGPGAMAGSGATADSRATAGWSAMAGSGAAGWVAIAGSGAAALGIAASVHSRTDPLWMWVPMQVVGVSFVAAGTIAWLSRPGNGTGRLMSAVGISWYVIDLRYSTRPALFAIGFCAFYLSPVIFTHLVLALPRGRLAGPAERVVVAGLYLSVLGSQTLRWFAEHPVPPQSWTAPSPTWSIWAPVGSVLGLVLTLAALVLVVRRWWLAGRPARLRHALAWITGAAVGLIVVVSILASLDQAGAEVHRRLAVTYILGLILTPFALLAGVLRVRMARGRVADLVVRLRASPEPRHLAPALADALGDPTVEVRFRLPGSPDHVDADGRPVPSPVPGDPGVTLVERHGEPLAALIHDPSLADQPSLVDGVVAAAGLALENARLHATQRAQLAEVRASRARIMASADAERHRIQRDLHDGAQHQLLAIAMLVDRAADELPRLAGNQPVAGLLDRVGTELHHVMRELRRLTEGLLPPVLVEQGLAAVVESLAERAPLPVTCTVASRRWPDELERTAYFIIHEGLSNVYKHAAASRAGVRVLPAGGCLVVEVTDDGAGGADPGLGSGLRGLRDRAAAVGGELRIDSNPSMGTRIVAELPCAS